MSNRQARIARKARQKAGEDVYTHLKPERRQLAPVGLVQVGQRVKLNGREIARRKARYGADTDTVPQQKADA